MRRTPPGAGRARARRRSRCRSRFWITWARTRFVLSPEVATTAASASSIPARSQRLGLHRVADDEAALPALAEPGERFLVLVDCRDVPAVGGELQRHGRSDPTAADHDCLHARSVTDTVAVIRLEDPSGKATTSTSQGALRRTWSTVGEKKRDWRRQRGDEPSTIRSAPRFVASSTIAWPMSRALTISRDDLDPVVLAECVGLGERRVGARLNVRREPGAVERERARHAHDEDRLHRRLALLGERDRGRHHLLADVPDLHRHEDLLERRRPGGSWATGRCRRRRRLARDAARSRTRRARPASQGGPA